MPVGVGPMQGLGLRRRWGSMGSVLVMDPAQAMGSAHAPTAFLFANRIAYAGPKAGADLPPYP